MRLNSSSRASRSRPRIREDAPSVEDRLRRFPVRPSIPVDIPVDGVVAVETVVVVDVEQLIWSRERVGISELPLVELFRLELVTPPVLVVAILGPATSTTGLLVGVVTELLTIGRTGSRGIRGDRGGEGNFLTVNVGVRIGGVGCLGGEIRTCTKGDKGGIQSCPLPLSIIGGDTLCPRWTRRSATCSRFCRPSPTPRARRSRSDASWKSPTLSSGGEVSVPASCCCWN